MKYANATVCSTYYLHLEIINQVQNRAIYLFRLFVAFVEHEYKL
jgi:hypothetical protein